MAYVFRLPADVATLVNELEGTLCQTLAARGGTPCARAVKAGLARLPRDLDEYIVSVLEGDVPAVAWYTIWPQLRDNICPQCSVTIAGEFICCRCAATPWLPSLVKAMQRAGSIADRPSHLFDTVCLWVEERLGPCGHPQITRLEMLSQTRQLDLWFQCEACGE